jgi:hypothetical protein
MVEMGRGLALVVVEVWGDHRQTERQVSALRADDLPSLRYFLWGRGIWPKANKEPARLFATFEEAQTAAETMAERGDYSDFALYVIERGRLRQIRSAVVRYGPGRITLDWTVDPDRPSRRQAPPSTGTT